MWESNYEPDARRHRCRPCRRTPRQAGRDGDRPARPLAPAVPRARAAGRRLDRLVGARPQARGQSAHRHGGRGRPRSARSRGAAVRSGGPPPADAAPHPRRKARAGGSGCGRRSAPRRDRRFAGARRPRRTARRVGRRSRALEPRPRPEPRGAREARLVTIEMGAFGADVSSPFVPVGVTPRYPPPRAHIKPDRGGSWLRRMMPVVLAHKWMFGFSLVASFLGLAVQVQIPNEVGQAIDALGKATGPSIEHFVTIIAVLAAVRFVLTYTSRNYLLKTAYRIEYDLRNIMYEHLSRMSFSFYDRVQSGQLISRANSDIRSVQMYLAFAPSILVQCSVALLAFAEMLSINVALALVTMSTMPFVYVVGVRMRKEMFPVSWLIQSRLADVATVVDENINGVRVVKSFAAEDVQLQSLTGAAMRAEWANVKDADIRARWSPLLENLPRLGQAIVLFYGGYLAINGHASVGDIVAFNAYVLMLQPPFRQLGMILMMGQRASASAQRIYEVLDEQPDVVDRPGAVDLVECRGDVHFDHVSFA